MLVQVIFQIFHCSHISKNYRLDDSPFESVKISLGVLITQEVVLLLVNQFDSLTCMVLLLNADLPIHLESRGFGHDMISIIESIMTNVMADGSSEHCQDIELVELGLCCDSLSLQHEVAMLSHVGGVQIIVILNRSAVLIVNLSDEREEFFNID